MENPSSIRIQRFLLPSGPEGGLGPLLYLLFAEDMKNHIEAGLRTFPDDTLLYGIGLTERQCAAEIQPCLDSLCSWAKRWKITLNPTKTKCLTVSRVGGVRYPLMMNHLFVAEVPLYKHLTVYLSHDWKWLCHTTEICKKATRLVILRRYSRKLSRKTLKMIYNAYIRPIIEYSNQVYTNLTLAYAEKLEELNRCGLRCVMGCKVGTSHQELYRETDELSLEERRKKSRMNKLYEVLKEDRSCRLNRGMIQTVGERNPHARRRVNDLTQLRATIE